ncbi:YncE family protein [Klebsiella aerogenes]|uniref:YncE family protein n=1 Tax=Klebsiella TaxID=570 RepID=UPI00049EEECC|nr:YncE family protein [Klebsiella aerogenes]EIV5804075.1 YncE family protein [Klebsiella aerogenes]EKQ6527578.1 YncE family protein [Klebsiella aerogenes]ELA2171771.1 YncE family protein [Klebsiella aerogenes]ELY3901791.1 YncE family protein [Klebsiella aerogenes]EMA4694194.1 YncE family protein [Klebsiella aerogenes]
MPNRNLIKPLAALLLAALLPHPAFAIDPPPREASRFAMKTNYLQEANEGVYELAFDNGDNLLFAAATDRVNRAANKGYLYAFNPATLQVIQRYDMPWRAFSLAMNQPAHVLYVGHTQAASLRISQFDAASGKITLTSPRLSFPTDGAADARFEHLRHMVYSRAANLLFVSYSHMLKTKDGMRPLHKLLMLDGTTLQLKGEVKDAYRGTAYGLTLDEKTQKIYVGGRDYVNEIDARTQQVVRTIPLNAPQLASAQNLIVDSDSGRIFVVAFDHDDRSGPHDGLYIFDLKDGKSLGYVRTGIGANAVRFNPKYNELYVSNFTSGTISVVDGKTWRVTHEFRAPVYPNQMVLSPDMDTLYVGIKEGFNREWDPEVFVEGAKERILRIDLRKS